MPQLQVDVAILRPLQQCLTICGLGLAEASQFFQHMAKLDTDIGAGDIGGEGSAEESRGCSAVAAVAGPIGAPRQSPCTMFAPGEAILRQIRKAANRGR